MNASDLTGKLVTFERIHPQDRDRIQTVRDTVEWASNCGRYFRLADFGHFGLGTLHPDTDRIVRVEDEMQNTPPTSTFAVAYQVQA